MLSSSLRPSRFLEEEDEGIYYTPTLLGNNKLVALSPKFPSVLSLIGSYVLIREIVTDLKTRRPRNSRPLLRALLAMSIADIFFTIPWFLTTWPAPSDLDYLWGNVGTRATCTAQGFMFQFGVQSGPLFNCTFSFFSLLMVRYQWNEQQLNRLEPWFHGGIWAYALAASIFPIPMGLYNNVWQICWLEGYPYDCMDSWSYGDEGDCTRGDNGWIYAIAFTFFPPWFCMLVSLVILYLIWRSVRHLENRLSRYAGSIVTKKSMLSASLPASSNNTAQVTNISNVPPAATSGDPSESSNHDAATTASPLAAARDSVQGVLKDPAARQANHEKSKAVARQAMWYITAFLITFLLDAILSVFYYGDLASEKALEPLDFFAYLVYPLQGFFNFLIFARPRKEMTTPEGRLLRKLVFGCCCCCCSNTCGCDGSRLNASGRLSGWRTSRTTSRTQQQKTSSLMASSVKHSVGSDGEHTDDPTDQCDLPHFPQQQQAHEHLAPLPEERPSFAMDDIDDGVDEYYSR